jgi:hypothetical protein
MDSAVIEACPMPATVLHRHPGQRPLYFGEIEMFRVQQKYLAAGGMNS